MFLWVRLVLAVLDRATTVEQMREDLRSLPPGLEKMLVVHVSKFAKHRADSPCSYDRILERILPSDASDRDRDQVSRVFQLLTYSRRPLKRFEIRDAVTLRFDVSFISDDNRVRDSVFEHCKPLIEIVMDDTVRFIHVSVKE
jgi:hypothetical protein